MNNKPFFNATHIQNYSWSQVLKNWFFLIIGILIAAHTSPNIHYKHNSDLFLAVLVLSFLNLIIKPILMLFAMPFIILSLGLGIWIINAFLLLMTSHWIPGFTVDTFSSALWGSLIISLVTSFSHKLFTVRIPTPKNTTKNQSASETIIDI